MELLERIGSFAGLAAFLGLAVLALLYFAQARDVRRLRDWAGRAPERAAVASETQSAALSEQAEKVRQAEEARRRVEEQRLAQQRAEAERATRRQQRQVGDPGGYTLGWRDRLPEPRYLALIIGGVIILGAGVAVGATQLLGGDEGGGKGGGAASNRIIPSQVEIAVLNGTAIPGLAAKVCDDVKANGFKCGTVTNSQSSFDTTVVMYERGHQREARRVGHDLGVTNLQVVTSEIKGVAGGASVAVVIGQDRAEA